MTPRQIHIPWIFWVTALTTALLTFTGAGLASQVAATQKMLQAFDLARAIIVSGSWHGALTMDRGTPQGRVDEFLMSLDSVDRLSKLPGIESLHVYRNRSLEGSQSHLEPTTVTLQIVPPGFLQAHHLGPAMADEMLAKDCVVMDVKHWYARGWKTQELVHWQPPAEVRRMISERAAYQRARNLPPPDNGEFDTPVCPAELNLPRGIRLFEQVAFISADHPALQGRSSGALPRLWLSVRSDTAPDATLARVRDFLAHEAQPAQPGITLEAKSFGEYGKQAMDGKQLAAWQGRLVGMSWLGGLALMVTLLLVRWGALRRELALRLALGQGKALAWRSVGAPYARRVLLGGVAGIFLGGVAALTGLHAPMEACVPTTLQLLLIMTSALLLLSAALGWAMRTPPLHVLNKGAL